MHLCVRTVCHAIHDTIWYNVTCIVLYVGTLYSIPVCHAIHNITMWHALYCTVHYSTYIIYMCHALHGRTHDHAPERSFQSRINEKQTKWKLIFYYRMGNCSQMCTQFKPEPIITRDRTKPLVMVHREPMVYSTA